MQVHNQVHLFGFKGIELIVSNNGNIDDNIRDVLKHWNFRIIDNKKNNSSEGRNSIVRNSVGNYILFLDDDVGLIDDYFKILQAELDEINNDQQITGVSGYVCRVRNNSKLDDAWIEAGFDRYFELPRRSSRLKWSCTANLLVKREKFINSGGFVNLGVPCGGEDIDFGLRLNTGDSYFKTSLELTALHEPINSGKISLLSKKAYYYGMSEQLISQIYNITVPKNLFKEFLSVLRKGSVYARILRLSFLAGGVVFALKNKRPVFSVSGTELAVINYD